MHRQSAILVLHARLAPLKRASLIAGALALMFLGMVAAFGTTTSYLTYPGRIEDIVESLGTPSPVPFAAESDLHAREIRIRPGSTVSTLLAELDIRDPAFDSFLRNNREAEALHRQLSPGKTLTAKVSTDGLLYSFVFPLNGGKDQALRIERTSSGFQATIDRLPFDIQVHQQSAVIRHSLFGAADEAGIPEGVAIQLADIFGGDIDFHRDLRKGDRFSVIYETTSYLGKVVRTQRILAAEFVNGGKTYQAFWYPDAQGGGGYYTADGQSVRKAFLRSPLEFSRISSGFTNARYHPVLREVRAHKGIDYAAPIGTRVKATGDGVIEFVGNQGGYGKVIMIRHSGNRTTVYGHLSGFAPGIRKGVRVAQGDVIGYVGATGLASGPHLHYEFRVAGVHTNPLTIALPNATPLPHTTMADFRERTSRLISQLATIRDLRLVMLD